MGYRNNGALEIFQVLFKPVDTFSVEMIGRFIQQQDIGLLQQGLAQSNPTALATRKLCGPGIGRGKAHGLHGHFELAIEVVSIAGVDFILNRVELVHGRHGVLYGRRAGHGGCVQALERFNREPGDQHGVRRRREGCNGLGRHHGRVHAHILFPNRLVVKPDGAVLHKLAVRHANVQRLLLGGVKGCKVAKQHKQRQCVQLVLSVLRAGAQLLS